MMKEYKEKESDTNNQQYANLEEMKLLNNFKANEGITFSNGGLMDKYQVKPFEEIEVGDTAHHHGSSWEVVDKAMGYSNAISNLKGKYDGDGELATKTLDNIKKYKLDPEKVGFVAIRWPYGWDYLVSPYDLDIRNGSYVLSNQEPYLQYLNKIKTR